MCYYILLWDFPNYLNQKQSNECSQILFLEISEKDIYYSIVNVPLAHYPCWGAKLGAGFENPTTSMVEFILFIKFTAPTPQTG